MGRCTNTVARTYDVTGRPASESLTIGGQTYTVSAAYGTTSPTITLTYPDSSVVVKTLNSRGLLASIDRNSGDVVDRTYTDAGRLATQTFVNSVVETWSWNNDGTVDSIDNPAGLFEYSYDANKNRTAESITGALSAASWSTGTTGFDNDDRLTYRDQGTGTLTEEWDLSLVGDWDEYTENSTAVARTHGPTHEILTVGSASLTHDSKGNLTTDEKGQLLAWDFDNMLVSVDTDADTNVDVEYEYDARARRVGRTEWDYSGMTPVSTTEVYAHWQDDIAADYTGGVAANSPLRDYIHGLRIDELIAMIDRTDAGSTSAGTDEPFYYHTDCVTSVRSLSDASGDAVEYYRYGSYGEPTVLDDSLATLAESPLNNRYCFTTREWDTETGLHHFRRRWLTSAVGIFVGRDPLEYRDGRSLYRAYFVPNGTDPTGRCAVFRCGPDISAWLDTELLNMRRWATRVYYVYSPDWVDEDRFADPAIEAIKKVAPELTYFPDTSFHSTSCPTQGCEDTVTLCGKCVHTSEIGNFVFGALAASLGLSENLTELGQWWGNRGDNTEQDKAAAGLGWDYVDSLPKNGKTAGKLCSFLRSQKSTFDTMGKGAPVFCELCAEAVNPDKNHTGWPPLKDKWKDQQASGWPVTVPGVVE